MSLSKSLPLSALALNAILICNILNRANAAEAIAQVPAFYHQQVGQYTVTALLDGSNYIKPSTFKGLSAAEQQRILQKYAMLNPQGIQTSVNAFAIDNGQSIVLIDSGAALCLSPNLGSVVKNLAASGYASTQVSAVILTHLHPDHSCGITLNGKAVYPNATIYVPKPEADFWLSPNTAQSLPASKRAGFNDTVSKINAALAPYQQANRFQTFSDNEQIKGLSVINSSGHTPGHRSYRLQSQGQAMVFVGDIVHSHSIQFEAPTTTVEFDQDPKQAIGTRLSLFNRLAQSQDWVAAPHLPFPGIGHIAKVAAQQYQWIPTYFNDAAITTPTQNSIPAVQPGTMPVSQP